MSRPARRSTTPVKDVAKVVHSMSSDFLQCRDFGHAWRPYTASWDSDERAYRVQLRCSRCRSVRVRLINQYGQQVGSHYEYRDGYLIEGIGRLTGGDRDAVRLESVRRVLPEDADEAVS